MFPFFSGSGSSSVLNFTEEGASMPSERADHSIVNYHDETPGAVDDVLTVRVLVSNIFDTLPGKKNSTVSQWFGDLMIWWWFDCFFLRFWRMYIEVISWVTSGGDFSFIDFAKSVSAGFLDEFSWIAPGLRWISNHLGILCQNSHWVLGARSFPRERVVSEPGGRWLCCGCTLTYINLLWFLLIFVELYLAGECYHDHDHNHFIHRSG